MQHGQSPLQRLYKTKLVLLAVVAVVAGSALLFAAHWVATQSGWRVVRELPVADIGSALFTSGLVVIFFEYLDKRDAELRAMQQLRTVLREEAPAIRDAVVDGFAFAPDSLTNVASPAVLDRIVENCLGLQLGDQALAGEVYTNLKAQVLHSSERWHDLRISAALSPWTPTTGSEAPPMFVTTVRFDYRVTNPSPVMRFACVSDLNEYRELAADPSFTEVWYFQRKPGMQIPAEDVFDLIEVVVDGKPQKARRTTKTGTQLYSVNLSPEVLAGAGEVAVTFTYRALLQQHGHVLYLDLVKPTKGLTMSLAYGGAGIQYVTVSDYVAAAKQPTISRLPASDPSPSVSLTFDGWVLPKGGASFVWVLVGEVEDALRAPASTRG